MRADSLYVMYILDVEGKVLARFSDLVAPADAEALRRRTPIRRNRFDNFIFEATRWAVDEGAANSFSFACEHFKAAHQEDSAAVGEPVPLVPPTVTEHVDRIVSRWRPGQRVPGAIDLPDEEVQLRDELYVSLGGDLGDGPTAAGSRLCSRMWSARIADGFVHPAIGGYIWNSNSGSFGGDDTEAGGPLIAAIYVVGDMTGRWQAKPENRPDIDREITDLAHTMGWKP